ncbi:glycosyltransferase [bacterium]|jgi:glycosyltransferase involved in cell wall biosynthesis|nr:glycosyltransferase [bacterium]
MSNKKELHILYIITKLELGGAQKVCLSLMQGLQKTGNHSFLISGNEGPLTSKVRNNPNVKLFSTFKREVFNPLHEFKNFLLLTKEIKKIKKMHPGLVVHTHSTKAGIVGRWAAWFAGLRKIVHTVHGYSFHSHQKKMVWVAHYVLEFLTSLITTHFVCVSSYDVKLGIKLFPRFEKKHSIIRAAIEDEKFAIPVKKTNPFPENGKPFIFGTTSCFKQQKNLPDLLKAFKAVYTKNPNVKLEIIGDGIMRKEIERYIKENQIGHVVVLHGWQENVVSIMENWHAFVMSSLWEGLPCAIVEARLLHLPIISYDTGGIHDVIINSKNGLLFKQYDWKSLAGGMHSISTNQQTHKKMAFYEDDLESFKTETMISEHIELYKNI